MKYSNFREREATFHEINVILREIKSAGLFVKYVPYLEHLSDTCLRDTAFIVVGPATISITTAVSRYSKDKIWDKREKTKPCTFHIRLDGESMKNQFSGADAYRQLVKMTDKTIMPTIVNLHELKKLQEQGRKSAQIDYYEPLLNLVSWDPIKERIFESASPLIGYKPEYSEAQHYIWAYDQNSAYSTALVSGMIDTEHYRLDDVVKENEVGFFIGCSDIKMTRKVGTFCDVVFPLIESPFKKFVEYYYKIKSTTTDKYEKARAKAYLNSAVGYLQRINLFMRAYVVETANENIRRYIDENTIMWNTDAIYSLVSRPDIPLGADLGQFKLEYEGEIYHFHNNYQKIDSGELCYRGVPKAVGLKGFSLKERHYLKPSDFYVYEFDKENFELKRKETI